MRSLSETQTSYAGGRHNMPHLARDLDLLTLKVVSVTCDVCYLCANFSFPMPLCSRLRPDVRDRQTSDVRRASSLIMLPRRGNNKKYEKFGIFPSGTAKSHPSYFLNNPVSNQNERIAKLSTSADRCSYTTL